LSASQASSPHASICDEEVVAQKISEGIEMVPKVIYHWGQKKHMLENAKKGTIGRWDWAMYIMGGSSSRYKLGSIRKGLYGTNNIINNKFGGGQYNWINEVHIKDECRKANKVIGLIGLTENPLFIDWFDEESTSLEEFKTFCFEGKPSIPKMNIKKFDDVTGYCANKIYDFIKDNDIKIIQDHFVKMSWYIRDRSCIQNIKGSDLDVLQMFSQKEALWKQSCKEKVFRSKKKVEEYVMTYTVDIFAMVIDALKSLHEQKQDLALEIEGIKEQIQNSNIDYFSRGMKGILETYERCKNTNNMSEFGPHILFSDSCH
jgi:hypothetical protein